MSKYLKEQDYYEYATFLYYTHIEHDEYFDDFSFMTARAYNAHVEHISLRLKIS